MTTLALQGGSAVVTGASSGIGRAIALRLAEMGADVLIHARRSEAAAEEVAAQIRSLGRSSQVRLADLAQAGAAARLVDDAWAWRDNVSVWVNNAGADVLTGEAAGWDFFRKLDELYQVDVRAGMEIARAAGKRMAEAAADRGGAASLITIGWDQVEFGMGGDSGEMFAAIKGAVMAFSRSLARSLAPNVRVNCIAPGWIKTSWGDSASDYWRERAVNESLLQRWGNPDDIADAVGYLASPAASFVTGQTLAVNGGFRHRY